MFFISSIKQNNWSVLFLHAYNHIIFCSNGVFWFKLFLASRRSYAVILHHNISVNMESIIIELYHSLLFKPLDWEKAIPYVGTEDLNDWHIILSIVYSLLKVVPCLILMSSSYFTSSWIGNEATEAQSEPSPSAASDLAWWSAWAWPPAPRLGTPSLSSASGLRPRGPGAAGGVRDLKWGQRKMYESSALNWIVRNVNICTSYQF